METSALVGNSAPPPPNQENPAAADPVTSASTISDLHPTAVPSIPPPRGSSLADAPPSSPPPLGLTTQLVEHTIKIKKHGLDLGNFFKIKINDIVGSIFNVRLKY